MIFQHTVGLLVGVFACGGNDKQQNNTPTITIMSHSDNVEVQDGYVEYFRAVVSDDDNEFDELSVAWYVGEQLVCDFEVANPVGESRCEIVFVDGDSNVIAEVIDSEGASGRDELNVAVLPTEAPLIELLSPLSENNYYTSDLVQFSALVSDSEDASEDLVILWTSSLDGELPLGSSIDTSGEISDYAYLTEGNHAIELRVEDMAGKVSIEEVVIQVRGENHIPSCDFTAPTNEESFVVNDFIVFSGTATDVDIPNNELTVELSSNLDGVFQTVSPFSDGTFSIAVDTLSTGTHTITLIVSDEVDAQCTTGMLLSVGTVPTVSIDQPLDSGLFSVGDTITFRGTATDNEDPEDQISVVWTSDIDGELQSSNPNSQGVSQFTYSELSAGVHSVSLSATDTSGLTSDDLISFRVNTLPVVDSITFTPNPVFSNTNLSTNYTTSDADGQNVSSTMEWFEDGLLTSFTGTAINASEFEVNEVWTIRITPNDGFQDGLYTEESITISNTLPIVGSVAISPNTTIYNDTILTCIGTATDIDQAITPTFQWTIDGQVYTGATLDLSSTPAMPNYVVACNAIATDDWGGTDMMTTTVTLENRPPSLGTVTITPDALGMIGEVLTCESIVTDPDGESLTPTYVWSVNGYSLGANSTFSLVPSLVNPSDVVTCTASVTDAFGESQTATGSFTVYNEPPVVNSLVLDPANPSALDTVTCTAMVTDPDGVVEPTITFLFENVTTGTTLYPNSTSLTDAILNLADVSLNTGDELACYITVTDNGGAITMDTVTTTIINSNPVVSNVSISPNVGVQTGDVLTCIASATDTEDGTISPTYGWTVNGNTVSSTSAYSITATDTDVGDIIVCTATATDLDGNATSATTDVTVINTSPIVTNIVINPSSTVNNDDTLICTATIDDPDETITPSILWNRNGSQFSVGATVNLGNYNVLPNHVIECVVSATDNQGATDAASGSLVIENRAPVLSTPVIDNTSPEATDTITCSATVADADGEIPTLSYSWMTGQTQLGTNASLTLTSNTVSSGDVLVCTVTALDNFTATDTASTSATVASSCGLTTCDMNLDLGGGQSMDLVLIPSGSDPQGRYNITSDFYLMTTEITQGMFTALMSYDPTTYSTTYGVGSDYPAYYVSWHMAADFANKATQRHNSVNGTNLQECYTCSNSGSASVTCTEAVNPYQCSGYVFPTEAEWEYAARSGTQYDFWTPDGGGNYSANTSTGNETIVDGVSNPLLRDYAWYLGNRNNQYGGEGSKGVGQKLPNGFGLYDMHGNVDEWTADWYGCSYPQSSTDPYCSTQVSSRVLRGGGWGHGPSNMESSSQNYFTSTFRGHDFGFRIGLHP